VRIFTANGGAVGNGFFAYDAGFNGGIYVGCGDVDATNPGDEIITGAGAGGGPHVKVFDRNGNMLGSFMAYDQAFNGGVRVASAAGAVITAPGAGGGPHVRMLSSLGVALNEWMAYAPSFSGGVYVGGGDVIGDATQEVLTGAGESGGPHVRVFSTTGGILSEFMAFNSGSDHGARVAAARVPGGAVVAGSGKGGPSLLHVITP
jgi:hypothetical protein